MATNEKRLNALVESAIASADFLSGRGLTSCLCDEIWMRRNSSPAEWIEYESVKRSYIEEVIYSSDPADILMSDPGAYGWRTSAFAERVRERYEQYGAVAELFSDRARRHLIHLSKVQQRLSIALEKGSPSAVAASNERLAIYKKEHESELQVHAEEISSIQSGMRSYDRAEVESAFVSLLLHRISGTQILDGDSPSKGGVVAAIPLSRGAMKVELNADCDSASKCSGRLFIDLFLDSRFVFYSRALPSKFDPYKDYENEAELALCLLAWIEILCFAVNWVKSVGLSTESNR